MTSLRHKSLDSARPPRDAARPSTDSARAADSADLALDAARDCILAVGWSRTALTEVARRAGVSRMTIYRRWPDMNALLGDLRTRDGSIIVQLASAGPYADGLALLVRSAVATIRAVRAN